MYKLRHYNHEYVIVMQIPIIQRVVPLTRYYNNIVNSNGILELGITLVWQIGTGTYFGLVDWNWDVLWFGRLELGSTLDWQIGTGKYFGLLDLI